MTRLLNIFPWTYKLPRPWVTSEVCDAAWIDLFQMVFSPRRVLSLSSKCCDGGVANHFKQGFLFLPSSLGLTWLEHGLVLILSQTHPALCTPILFTVRTSLNSPLETSRNTCTDFFIILCLGVHCVTQY